MGCDWYDIDCRCLKGVIILYKDMVKKYKQAKLDKCQFAHHNLMNWLTATLLEHSMEDSICVTNIGDLVVLVSRDPPESTINLDLCGPYEAEYPGKLVKVENTTGLAEVDATLMQTIANACLCDGVMFSKPATWLYLSSTRYMATTVQISRPDLDSLLQKKQKTAGKGKAKGDEDDHHSKFENESKIEDGEDGEDGDEDADDDDETGIYGPITLQKKDFITVPTTKSEFVIDAPVLIDESFQDISFKLANGMIVGCNRVVLATSSDFFKKCLMGEFKRSNELVFESFDASAFQIFLQVIVSKDRNVCLTQLLQYLETEKEVAKSLLEIADFFCELDVVKICRASLLTVVSTPSFAGNEDYNTRLVWE